MKIRHTIATAIFPTTELSIGAFESHSYENGEEDLAA